ncbi:MAG: L,D-transpeptidase [Pseudobdellovibrionaceae bacterium]
MRRLVLFFFIISFIAIKGQAQEVLPNSLDDLLTPDEIATELGFPRTERSDHALSIEEIFKTQAVDVTREYPLVVIVNKKAFGYGAQRAQVYENGVLTNEWKVSTGREQWETSKSGKYYFTTTPVGYFHPHSLLRYYWSDTWDALMEFSVFFNGGIAIHATTPNHYRQLGSRASGGCVRLNKENAQNLYEKVQQLGKGLVPVINRYGQVKRDRKGHLVRTVNWRTLIVVEEN